MFVDNSSRLMWKRKTRIFRCFRCLSVVRSLCRQGIAYALSADVWIFLTTLSSWFHMSGQAQTSRYAHLHHSPNLSQLFFLTQIGHNRTRIKHIKSSNRPPCKLLLFKGYGYDGIAIYAYLLIYNSSIPTLLAISLYSFASTPRATHQRASDA
jgi:hypothetical protein